MTITSVETRALTLAGCAFVVAALLPSFATGYALSISVNIVMYAALCTAWTLFSGPTHYISLATAAFFGVGMYTIGLGINTMPFPVLVIIAALASAVLAGLVGIATLRLSGVYFVIFTLGLAELVRQVVTWWQTNFTTAVGLYVFPDVGDPNPVWQALDGLLLGDKAQEFCARNAFCEQHIFWLLLALTALIFLVGWLVNRSRLGFAMRIIGNDETVAAHVGINTAGAKVLLFVISGAFIGIVGALLAPRFGYVEPPSAFNPLISFQVVIMALLGGTRRLWGPLVGVIPYTFLIDFINAEFPDYSTIVIGVAFIVIVYLLPDGVTGRLEQLVAEMRAGRRLARAPRKEPAE